MTIHYALKLKKKLKCLQCSKETVAERSFCAIHLHYAREQWRKHVVRCQKQMRCINCSRHNLVGEQRCFGCKKTNQKRCLSWFHLHRGFLIQRRKERIAQGWCGECGKRPCVQGHTRCLPCNGRPYKT